MLVVRGRGLGTVVDERDGSCERKGVEVSVDKVREVQGIVSPKKSVKLILSLDGKVVRTGELI